MTDEHEHAMKVWEEAFAAWDDTPADPNAMHSGDQAAAAVIAADRAGLEAEVKRLREAFLKCAEPSRYHAPCPSCGPKIVEQGCYIAHAALKEPSHDA